MTNFRGDEANFFFFFFEKKIQNGRLKKGHFSTLSILNIFFASSPWKLVTNYVLEWMGLNFQYYDGLQPKLRAGIINEHECKYMILGVNKIFLKSRFFLISNTRKSLIMIDNTHLITKWCIKVFHLGTLMLIYDSRPYFWL